MKTTLLSLLIITLTGCYDQVATHTGFGITNTAPPCESVPYSSLNFPSNMIVIDTGNGSFGNLQMLRIGKSFEPIKGVKNSYSLNWIHTDDLFYFKETKEVLNPEVNWPLGATIVFCKKSFGADVLAFVRSSGGLYGDGWGAIKLSQGGLFAGANNLSVQLGWPTHSAAKYAHSNPSLVPYGLDDEKYLKGSVEYTNPADALSIVSKLDFRTERSYTKSAKFVKSCVEMKERMNQIGFYAPNGEHLDCEKYPW